MTGAYGKRGGNHEKTQKEKRKSANRRDDSDGSKPAYPVISEFQPIKL